MVMRERQTVYAGLRPVNINPWYWADMGRLCSRASYNTWMCMGMYATCQMGGRHSGFDMARCLCSRGAGRVHSEEKREINGLPCIQGAGSMV